MAFDKSVDLLVVGSGAGGMTAALRGTRAGANVLVVEKSALWGGTSATSGGGIWIPASHLAEKEGFKDNVEDAFQYVRALTADNVTDEQVRSYVENAAPMLKWVEENAGAQLIALPYPDYYPEIPGVAKEGYRTHLPLTFNAREMRRESFDTMQTTSPAANLWGRINWLFSETYIALYRPKGWWKTVGKMLARYWLDIPQRLRSRRDRRLTLGVALLGWLRKAYDADGGEFWLESPFVSLIEENGRVVGAVVRHEGRDVRVEARKGVILAAGGFERNAEMRAKYLPGPADPTTSGSQICNEGDALVAAQQLGAAVRNMDSAWVATVFRIPGEERARLSTSERALPHSLIVNQAGKRYANEALAYHRFAQVMLEKNAPGAETLQSWFIFDATYRWRYPIGPVIPFIPDMLLHPSVRKILKSSYSIEGLARQINVPEETLAATVSRFNEMAHRGKDDDFGRGDASYDRLYGDARQQPNPSLGAVETGPYYAMPIYLGDIGTNGGLVTDEKARVLRADGSSISGLYAIGNMAASVMGYSYPGAGSTLGPAMAFGWLAAADACGVNEGA